MFTNPPETPKLTMIRQFLDDWSRKPETLPKTLPKGQAIDLFELLVYGTLYPNNGLASRCDRLETELSLHQDLPRSVASWKVSVRLAVIEGFLRLAFPTTLDVELNPLLPRYDTFTRATRVAAQLGLYLSGSKLQSKSELVVISNQWMTLRMTEYSWLCPHGLDRFEDATSRWRHVVSKHSGIFVSARVMQARTKKIRDMAQIGNGERLNLCAILPRVMLFLIQQARHAIPRQHFRVHQPEGQHIVIVTLTGLN